MSEPEPNAVVAFCLVLGAGAATGIGASVVFFPRLVVLTSNLVLAGALGVSAGVMIYVSFVEIFMKSSMAFADAGYSEDHAFCLATATFFAGTLLMMVCSLLLFPPFFFAHIISSYLAYHTRI
mmetsp:Transcript_29486/g.67829  ORF Transcript_29486/g.67829 Transcript_29486/m.67829 type:complete len:123 (+) Transcript_29486:92-460(+)